MLNKLLEQVKGQYFKEDLLAIEEIERQLNLEVFNSEVALNIGRCIVECSKKYNEDLAIKIIRTIDNETIFQYIGPSKASRNINFATMKENTVKLTKHSSIWSLIKKEVDGGLEEVFKEGSDCLPVAGAFPLIVGDELVGIVSVSGMHEGNDHRAIVDGLAKYLNLKISEFKGLLV